MHPIGPYLESKTVGKRMRVGIRLSWCVCLVLVLLRPVSGENKARSYDLARRKAAELADLYAGPVELRGTVRLHTSVAELSGSYRYIQASKDGSREELQFPEFTELRIRKSGTRYISRSTSMQPLLISYAHELITGRYSMPDNLAMTTVSNAVQDGRNAICYRKAGPTPKYAACFDVSSGVLMSWDWQSQGDEHRFEYSNFVNDGGKMVARTMRRLKNGKLLVEVEINSVSHGSPADWIFDAPSNAIKQEECKKFEQATRFYTPSFFSLLSHYQSERDGTVIIAGVLDDHGRIVEKEIQQFIGTSADNQVLGAMEAIQFTAAKCDGRRVPSLFRFEVWFSRQMWQADSFLSFLD